MKHPVEILARVTKMLDRLVQDYGDYIFAVFVFLCLGVIIWMFTRHRKRPTHEVPVVILPLGNPPRREPESEPSSLFEEHPDQ